MSCIETLLKAGIVENCKFINTKKPFIALAPMAGLSTPVFRKYLFDNEYIDLEWTPFVRVSRHSRCDKAIKRELLNCSGKMSSILQLMGTDAETLANAALEAEKFGIKAIDLNAGCPDRMVNKKGAGAALLQNVPLLIKIIQEMRKNFSGFFSVKIRSGYNEVLPVKDIVNRIEDAGADLLVLHPRLAVQMYQGSADWTIIEEVSRKCSIPVVGNGDILNPDEGVSRLLTSGCAGLMIGRGLVRNPWLIRQILENLEGGEYFRVSGSMLADHLKELGHQMLLKHQKPEFARNRMIPHARYIGTWLDDAAVWVKKACRSKTYEEFLSIAEELREVSDLRQLNGPLGRI